MRCEHPNAYNPINPKSVSVSCMTAVRSTVSNHASAWNDSAQMTDGTLWIADAKPVVEECGPLRTSFHQKNFCRRRCQRLQTRESLRQRPNESFVLWLSTKPRSYFGLPSKKHLQYVFKRSFQKAHLMG